MDEKNIVVVQRRRLESSGGAGEGERRSGDEWEISGILDWSGVIWGDEWMSDGFYDHFSKGRSMGGFLEGFLGGKGRQNQGRSGEEVVRQYLYVFFFLLFSFSLFPFSLFTLRLPIHPSMSYASCLVLPTKTILPPPYPYPHPHPHPHTHITTDISSTTPSSPSSDNVIALPLHPPPTLPPPPPTTTPTKNPNKPNSPQDEI